MIKIFILFLGVLTILSSAQVLGIDFGTQFWKASLISPGKNLVIVQNSRSGRKSINGIAFAQGVRHFQDDAFYKRLKKPKESYFYLNKLLRSLDFQKPLEGYHYQNGTYHIVHQENQISLEQLVGMILKNIKLHAGNQAGSQIKDTVMAIPANWGWKAKMALVNAASIADLSILGLINQNSAAAINFAITRNDTDPINIGFFNLGSHNLQFSIMQFFGYHDQIKDKNIQSLKVLSHIVVQDVGGLFIDKQIANYLADQFKKKHKIDPRSNQKSFVKLLHKCAQIKEVLSANKDTQVYIQGLIDGIDLNLPVSRTIIQNILSFKNLNQNLDQALLKAGISKSDLNSIQMIGGASRIPIITKILKDNFPDIQVGSHINGDQAMAFGSSLRAANLSIAFRVKQLYFYDGFDQEIKVIISTQEEGVIGQQTLFTKQNQHGDKKNIILKPTEDNVKLSLYYGQDLVKEYMISNSTSWKQKYTSNTTSLVDQPTLIVSFALSTVSIAEIKEVYVNITLNKTQNRQVIDYVEEIIEQQNETINETTQKNNQTQTQSEKENTLQSQQINPQETQKTDKETQKTDQETQKTDKQTEKADQENQKTQKQSDKKQNQNEQKIEKEKKKKKGPKTRMNKVIKQVEEHVIQIKKHATKFQDIFNKYPALTKEQIKNQKLILQQYEKHEKLIKEKAKIRNDLESTLYNLKGNLQQAGLKQFSKQAQLQNLKNVIQQKLSWFDQNAWSAQKDQFQKHFNQLYSAYEPMYNRSLQYRDRQKAYNQTIQFLSMTYYKTVQLNNTHPWLKEKMQIHLAKINSTAQEIRDRLQKQFQRALNEVPIIFNHQMIELAEKLRDEYYLLKMIPRPKIQKKPKTQQTQKEDQKQNNNNEDQPQNKQQTQQQQKEQNENNQNEKNQQQQTENQQAQTENQQTQSENQQRKNENQSTNQDPKTQQDVNQNEDL